MKRPFLILLIFLLAACSKPSTPVVESSVAAIPQAPNYELTKAEDAKSYDDLAQIENAKRANRVFSPDEIQPFANAYMRFTGDDRARAAAFRLVREILVTNVQLPKTYEAAAMTIVPLTSEPSNISMTAEVYRLLKARMPATFSLDHRYDAEGMTRFVTGEDPFTDANVVETIGALARFTAAANIADAKAWKRQYADALVTTHVRCPGCEQQFDGVKAYALYSEIGDRLGMNAAAEVAGLSALHRYARCTGECKRFDPVHLADARVWLGRSGRSSEEIAAAVRAFLSDSMAAAQREKESDTEIAAFGYVLEHGEAPAGYRDGNWSPPQIAAPVPVAPAAPPVVPATTTAPATATTTS